MNHPKKPIYKREELMHQKYDCQAKYGGCDFIYAEAGQVKFYDMNFSMFDGYDLFEIIDRDTRETLLTTTDQQEFIDKYEELATKLEGN